MSNTLSEHLRKNEASTKFHYIGDIYGPGDDEWEPMTGAEIANFVDEMGDTSPVIDHPAYGGSDGFYFQSGDIWHNDGADQCVFERRG